MRFFSRALIGFLLILMTLGILYIGYSTYRNILAEAPEPFKRTARERVWQVETTTLQPTDVPISVRAFGTVSAGKTLGIRSETAGKIIQVYDNLQNGKIVKKDELLFSVDPFRIEQDLSDAQLALDNSSRQIEELELQISNEQSSQLERLQELEIAQDDLKRQVMLRERDFVSDAAVERAKLAVNNAERVISSSNRAIALLESKAQQLEIARQRAKVNLDRVTRNLNTTEFRAPFSGLLSNVSLELGRVIGTNDNLATLTDLSGLEVSFRIPDKDIGQMLTDDNANTNGVQGIIGREVSVIWKLGANKLSFNGEVSRIGANVDASLGGLEVFAVLKGLSENTPLRPGAYVEINLNAGVEKNVFALPQAAISPSGQMFYVDKDSRVEILNVDVIRREGDDVLVRGNVPQDKGIITRRFPQISQGVKVKVARNSNASNEDQTQKTEVAENVTLSPETQAMLIKRFENVPIPPERKKQIIANIESGKMKRAALERMVGRMGLEIPELAEPAAQTDEPSVTPSNEIRLTPVSQGLLLARINASPIPADRKKRIIEGIKRGTMDRTRLERMAERMGLELPELKE